MPAVFSIPKVQLIIALLLIYLTAFAYYPSPTTLYLLAACVGFTTLFDLLCTYLRRNVFFVPYAAIITGLIIALLIDPSTNVFHIATVTAVAMAVKNFVRFSGRQIFNPAASGLLVGLLFGQYTAWWGVSFQTINQLTLQNFIFFCILLLPGFVSGVVLRRYYSTIAFILTTIFVTQALSPTPSLTSILGTLINPALLFFALVMLPEPMTSPVNYKRQILYGVFVAILPFLFSQPWIAIDRLIFSLLIGNVTFFKRR